MKTLSVILLWIYIIPAGLYSQSPENEDLGKLFIEALNSDSQSYQKELASRIYSKSVINSDGYDKILGMLYQLRKDFAPSEFHHSEINSNLNSNSNSGDSKIIMHVYAKKEGSLMWSDFQFYLEPEPPHKISKLVFIAEVSEPVNLPNGSVNQKETLDWLDAYVQKLNSDTDLSGSILIAKGNDILFEKYFGFSDVERNIPVSASTLFNIASGGKMLTALCIAKLVEDGKIKYSDKLSDYIVGFIKSKDKEFAGNVTIHNLLSHTSGIGEYWNDNTDEEVFRATSINDHLKIVLQTGFESTPGSGFEYRNSNYILLGAIIEKLSGMSYYDFVQKEIFDPAGMASTGFFNYGSTGLAIPLARTDGEINWTEAEHGIKGSSAGGAYSNVRDILKFSNALRNDLIVSRDTFKELIKVQNTGFDSQMKYGYGFIPEKYELENSYGHGGTAAGVNFEFRYFPQQDITLVVFSNQNNGAYDDLKRNSIKLISGMR